MAIISQMSDNSTIKNEITVVKKPPTQKTVNSILIIAAVIVFAVVILSYFVEDLNIFANLTLKELTSGALWVCVGCFSISEIIKKVAINRAKQTTAYTTEKKRTDKKLAEYSKSNALKYAAKYCQNYEKELLKATRTRILENVGIDYGEFEKNYLAKSVWTIFKNYKHLSFKQIGAIWRANKAKRSAYNPDFLRTTVKMRKNLAPSEAYDVDKKNFYNTILSFVFSIGGGVFAFTIARDLVISFSIETMIEAAIKVAVIVISSAFRASFGWSLIMDTEINRLIVQRSECDECVKWSKKEYPEEFENVNIIVDGEDEQMKV